MKRVLVAALLLLFTLSGLAAEQEPAGKAPQPGASGEPKPEVTVEQEPRPEQPQPTWPRPYKPSEEISADSVVPFPADI